MGQTIIQQLTELLKTLGPLLTTLIGAFTGAFSAYWLNERKENSKLRKKYLNILSLISAQLNDSIKILRNILNGSLNNPNIINPRLLWTDFYSEIVHYELFSVVKDNDFIKHIRNIYSFIEHWNNTVNNFYSPHHTGNPRQEIINLLMDKNPHNNIINSCERVKDIVDEYIDRNGQKKESNKMKKMLLLLFFISWILAYLWGYVSNSYLFIIGTYLVFTIFMYFLDLKFFKTGILSRMKEEKEYNTDDPGEKMSLNLYETTTINTLSIFAAISIALLAFTVGYFTKDTVNLDKAKTLPIISLVPIFISTLLFLLGIELQSTSLAVKWNAEQKKFFTNTRRWLYIISWHALWTYIFIIFGHISIHLLIMCITILTILVFWYYFHFEENSK